MKFAKPWFWLVLILLLAAVLRFWGLNREDIQSDAAVNSVRALGWFDFLTGERQTSPIIWFGQIPWWGKLSFHDHPPLAFFIQHWFLKIFGQSAFATLLSFGLAGLGTTFLIYLAVKRFREENTALLASFLFALSSYAVWNSRTGYLEGLEIFFVSLSVYFFVLYLQRNENKYWPLWVLAAGMAILSKYTAAFLLPAAFAYILFWQRAIFRDKKFWMSLGLLLLVLSPAIIYNLMVYQTRGHFDAALSSMLGTNPADYAMLTRKLNLSFTGNLYSMWDALRTNTSGPFLVLELVALGHLILKIIRGAADPLRKILFLNTLFLVVMFAFAGAAPRFFPVILPFLLISVAITIADFWQKTRIGQTLKYASALILMLIFAFELFYAVNSNLLTKPLGKPIVFYSPYRFYQTGFNKLDKYLRQHVYGELPPAKKITKLEDVLNSEISGREVILFDDRPDWNMRLWYVHRYQAYYDIPIIYLSDAARQARSGSQIFQYLTQNGAAGFWFVSAHGRAIDRKDFKSYNQMMDGIETNLEKSGITPSATITNYAGEMAFKIYHFRLN